DPLLRVDQLRLLREKPEEAGVEHVDVREEPPGAYVTRPGRILGIPRFELGGGIARDAVAASLQVAPACRHVGRPGEAPRHADDRDALHFSSLPPRRPPDSGPMPLQECSET